MPSLTAVQALNRTLRASRMTQLLFKTALLLTIDTDISENNNKDNNEAPGIVSVFQAAQEQKEKNGAKEGTSLEDLSTKDIEARVAEYDKIINEREAYIKRSNTPLTGSNSGVGTLTENEFNEFTNLTGELQRRNTISAKEAKERVAKKRAERLAAMKQAEKKETEDVNLYRSAEEQSDSIDTELDQIRQMAIAESTYMKAPNGKPTNLTERQWLEVRTKAFKEWFGDWLKAYRIEKLRNSNPVDITGEEYVGKYELNRNSAKQWMKDNLKGSYVFNDTGEQVEITRLGINKTTSHSMGSDPHLKSIVVIPELIKNGIFIAEEKAERQGSKYDSYQYYVTGMKIGSDDYTVKITIGVDENKFYDHALTEIEKTKLIDYLNQPASGFISTEAEPDPSVAGIKDTKLLSILNNKSSKVVNENGEPLPVWHITNEDFTKFETSKARQNADIPAFYFATNKEDWKDMGKRAMSVFLNLRNPVEKPDANMQGSTVKERLLEKGVDGTYVIEDGQVAEYAAFFPNQIKSAADNVGTFDNENEDIRFRINRQ